MNTRKRRNEIQEENCVMDNYTENENHAGWIQEKQRPLKRLKPKIVEISRRKTCRRMFSANLHKQSLLLRGENHLRCADIL